MGAVLDTPKTCPLCHQLTPDPVVLKCNHRFCQGCIGDLWSVTPNGPYHCPEWKCKTMYRSLPFENSSVRPLNSSQPGQRRDTAGTSDSEDPFSSTLKQVRFTLSSQLLGKRKSSAAFPEQPTTKRSNYEFSQDDSSDTETPTTSSPGKLRNPVFPEKSQQPLAGADSKHEDEVTVSVKKSLKGVSRRTLDREELADSDSSGELDLCDSPLTESPKHDTPKKLSAPTSPSCGDGMSPQELPSVSPVKRTPPAFPKRPASTSSSPISVGSFARSENKHSSLVPCHYCPKTVHQAAVRTCLVCGASMCKEHLRPHLESPVFQSHTLVSPVEDITLWKCLEHQEMNRIYCRQCATCVCTVCTVIGAHREHACISIREAESELRANLKEEIRHLQETEQQVKAKVNELSDKKETSRALLTEAQNSVKQQYGTIREALEEEEQSALQCVLKEEKRVMGGLEQKLSILQNTLQSVQNGLHTLENLADAKRDQHTQDQVFIMEYSKVSQLASDVGTCVELFETPEEVDCARLNCLRSWTEKRLDAVVIHMPGKDRDLYKLQYGVIPLLDEDTAHPKLELSENRRRVSYNDIQQPYLEHPSRFTSFPQVLASDALESGCWYWEANVSLDDGRWKVGLCEGQMERKGQKDSSRLGFNPHSWCLAYDKKKLEVLHNKESISLKAERLQTVGVFLDFENGNLSFFHVTPEGSLDMLHSFQQDFSGPLYPAFSVSKTQLTISDLFQ